MGGDEYGHRHASRFTACLIITYREDSWGEYVSDVPSKLKSFLTPTITPELFFNAGIHSLGKEIPQTLHNSKEPYQLPT
jgi:hypothetical protein